MSVTHNEVQNAINQILEDSLLNEDVRSKAFSDPHGLIENILGQKLPSTMSIKFQPRKEWYESDYVFDLPSLGDKLHPTCEQDGPGACSIFCRPMYPKNPEVG